MYPRGGNHNSAIHLASRRQNHGSPARVPQRPLRPVALLATTRPLPGPPAVIEVPLLTRATAPLHTLPRAVHIAIRSLRCDQLCVLGAEVSVVG